MAVNIGSKLILRHSLIGFKVVYPQVLAFVDSLVVIRGFPQDRIGKPFPKAVSIHPRTDTAV